MPKSKTKPVAKKKARRKPGPVAERLKVAPEDAGRVLDRLLSTKRPPPATR